MKSKLLILAILLPIAAYANDEDALMLWIGTEVLVLIGFVITIFQVKVNRIRKGLMILIFIASQYLTVRLTEGIYYRENILLVNFISIAIPALTTAVSYWALRSKFRKESGTKETRSGSSL